MIRRLRCIEGRVRGVIGMIERDRCCPDILHQLSAGRPAPRSPARRRRLRVREEMHVRCISSVASPVHARTCSRGSSTDVLDPRLAIPGRAESLKNSPDLLQVM
ncbi:MAG: metal-sensing transcriptional repressor [Pseudomonadota bacterium]